MYQDDTPELEAYSRVTNPERFRPLHRFAEETISNLTSKYDVDVVQETNLVPDGLPEVVRRTTLKPNRVESAKIVISFTSFPGLLVKFGDAKPKIFPTCGCDACSETAEDEIGRLSSLIDDHVSGRLCGGEWPRRG